MAALADMSRPLLLVVHMYMRSMSSRSIFSTAFQMGREGGCVFTVSVLGVIGWYCFHSCSSRYSFELSPRAPPSGALPLPIGCISVLLSFPSARCLCDEATVSLLLPKRREKGVKGERRPQGGSEETLRSWLQHQGGAREQEDAELLCGPVQLKPLVDITGCSVQVSR